MVDFWFNHFNVFASKGEVRWYVTAYERDVDPAPRARAIPRPAARHRAPPRDALLPRQLAERAAGLRACRGGPDRGRRAGLNENYARELMELHTLGVDGGYTQEDVTEVARAFTGWTHRPAARATARFVFRPARTTPATSSCSGA